MNTKTAKVVSILLSVTGAAGVVATSYLAVKEAPKAKEELEKLGEKPDFWSKAKCFIKNYKKTLAAGTLTIGSNVASAVLTQHMVANLSATIVGLQTVANNSEKFKQKAKEVIGKENYNKITKAFAKEEAEKIDISNVYIPEGNILIWEEHLGFMIGTREKIYETLNYMARKFVKNTPEEYDDDWTFTFADFIAKSDVELLAKEEAKPYLLFGWGYDHLGKMKEDMLVCIDEDLFKTEQKDKNGNPYYELRFNYAPVYDPIYFEDAMRDETEIKGYLNAVPEGYKDEMRKELGYEPKH